jgi:hypothetical protein
MATVSLDLVYMETNEVDFNRRACRPNLVVPLDYDRTLAEPGLRVDNARGNSIDLPTA